MASFVTFTVYVICVAIIAVPLIAGDGQCIRGKYHKASPGPEVGQFDTCTPYESNACCTPQFTKELARTRTEKLYNHTWDVCSKKLSKECEKYWVVQECFYQCDPYVYKWLHNARNDSIHGVPICSNYCDRWFDACKDDHICVEDVLNDYSFDKYGANRCPANSTCQTYASMFKDGKGLCNKMWDTSYVYSTNKSSCITMKMDTSPTASGIINIASILVVMVLSLLTTSV